MNALLQRSMLTLSQFYLTPANYKLKQIIDIVLNGILPDDVPRGMGLGSAKYGCYLSQYPDLAGYEELQERSWRFIIELDVSQGDRPEGKFDRGWPHESYDHFKLERKDRSQAGLKRHKSCLLTLIDFSERHLANVTFHYDLDSKGFLRHRPRQCLPITLFIVSKNGRNSNAPLCVSVFVRPQRLTLRQRQRFERKVVATSHVGSEVLKRF